MGKIREFLMNMIGLEYVTNQQALIDEFAELEAEAFDYLLLSRQSDLTETLETMKCSECKAAHGGKCPAPGDDDPCVITLSEWLKQPCKREKLLGAMA